MLLLEGGREREREILTLCQTCRRRQLVTCETNKARARVALILELSIVSVWTVWLRDTPNHCLV